MKDVLNEKGYLFCPKLIADPENLYCDPHLDDNGGRLAGQINYYRKDKFTYEPEEKQVIGSLARYNIPIYKNLHYMVRRSIEDILGMDLHPTYFYDRFYYMGQELKKHTDRPACEISVTLQISSNNKEPWPIWFENSDGSKNSIIMENGDAAIYKGCEIPHWRESLTSRYNKAELLWRKARKLEDDTYHHQIFMHYVDAQGKFVQHAFDR